MEYDDLIDEIRELDQRLQDLYTEINETVYKSESSNGLVTIDLKGSFEVKRVSISDSMNYSDEELEEAMKEAFNNALMKIKRERSEAIMTELFEKIGEC